MTKQQSIAKARDVLAMRVVEAAGAIVQQWEGGTTDPGNILDHVDSSILGKKALRSPVVRNWIVKLVRQQLTPKEVEEVNEFPPIEEFTRRDTVFTFIWGDFTVDVYNQFKRKHMSWPDACSLKGILLSKGFTQTMTT